MSLEKGAYIENLHMFRIVILNQSSFLTVCVSGSCFRTLEGTLVLDVLLQINSVHINPLCPGLRPEHLFFYIVQIQ